MTKDTTPFHALHQPGKPLILCNIWDVGSALSVAAAGAAALATSSWAVAAARGLDDGQAVTLEAIEALTHALCAATRRPVCIDMEAGYGDTPASVAGHVSRIEAAGASGINLEDQIIHGTGLVDIGAQSARIAAIRAAGTKLFVNARTDVVLKAGATTAHCDLLAEVIARGRAYAAAGADGFFVPGLSDPELVAQVCDAVPVPINVMVTDASTDLADLKAAGVARISRGPGPYLAAMARVEELARAA